jgi:hypothetical protein
VLTMTRPAQNAGLTVLAIVVNNQRLTNWLTKPPKDSIMFL